MAWKDLDEIIVILTTVSSLAVAASFDSTAFASHDLSLVQDYAEQVRNIQQPFLLFSIASVLGVLSTLIGVALFFFRKKIARHFLIAAIVLTLTSFPMVNLYVDSSVSAGASFVFAVCLGWLVGATRSVCS